MKWNQSNNCCFLRRLLTICDVYENFEDDNPTKKEKCQQRFMAR